MGTMSANDKLLIDVLAQDEKPVTDSKPQLPEVHSTPQKENPGDRDEAVKPLLKLPLTSTIENTTNDLLQFPSQVPIDQTSTMEESRFGTGLAKKPFRISRKAQKGQMVIEKLGHGELSSKYLVFVSVS